MEPFADYEPHSSEALPVGDGHTLRVELSGSDEGVPVVLLHGGPGAGSRPRDRRFFNPERWRIVQFDQRGCGRSTPAAELHGNTTQHLIADIERLREHLGVEAWAVAGGSWGSFLGLAYAQAHPERCLGLRLHGIFLGSRREIDGWFYGIRNTFPERWEAFAEALPEIERDDLLMAYHRRLVDPDPAVHLPAAIALRTFSAWTQTFAPDPEHVAKLTAPEAALPVARLFTHYCVHGAFMPPGALLAGVARIRHLPAQIVQGRYDVVTPMRSAYALAKAWPEAAFTVVNAANHVTSEPEMAAALTAATARLHAAITGEG